MNELSGAVTMKSFNVLYAVCFILAIGAIIRQFSFYDKMSSNVARASETKRVALTFDDGPHPVYTPRILEMLSLLDVNATFFVTGENANANPDIIRQMYEEGHLIGNHTYSHIQLTSYNKEEFCMELIQTNEVISSLTGQEVSFVRPPYGTWDKKFEGEINLFPVLWSIDTLDWCSVDVSLIADRVLKVVKDGDIILMHDCYSTTVEAARIVIIELQKRGFEFVTVEKLLFDF
jgi:peptidoglycan/xylan/chitin deacetylase (PgdA/CDA1 family)